MTSLAPNPVSPLPAVPGSQPLGGPGVNAAGATLAQVSSQIAREVRLHPIGSPEAAEASLIALGRLYEVERSGQPVSLADRLVLSSYQGISSMRMALVPGHVELALARAETGRLTATHQMLSQTLFYREWEQRWGSLVVDLARPLDLSQRQQLFGSLNEVPVSHDMAWAPWMVAWRAGFESGRILHMSGGSRSAMMTIPASIMSKSRLTSVVRDPFTVRIERALGGGSMDVHYGDVREGPLGVPDAAFDLVVVQAPQTLVAAAPVQVGEQTLSLVAATLQEAIAKVKPGGMVVAHAPQELMDVHADYRAELGKQADFLAAIRVAGSMVDSQTMGGDLMLFRRREAGQRARGAGWVARLDLNVSHPDQPRNLVNEYYGDHPEAELARTRDRSLVDRPLREALEIAIDRFFPDLHRGVLEVVPSTREVPTARLPNGSFVRLENRPMPVGLVTNGIADAPPWRLADGQPNPSFRGPRGMTVDSMDQLILDGLDLADAYRAQIERDRRDSTTDDESERGREDLRQLYERWVERWGHISQCRPLHQLARTDLRLSGLGALERVRRRPGHNGREVIEVTPSRFLLRRMLRPDEKVERTETLADAIHVCRAERGEIHPPRIAELMDWGVGEACRRMSEEGLAFLDPESAKWVPRAEYLSGFLRTKLAAAERAQVQVEAQREENLDLPSYNTNVDALRRAMPVQVSLRARAEGSLESSVTLGASWVGADVVKAFVCETMGQHPSRLRLNYLAPAARWVVDPRKFNGDTAEAAAYRTFNFTAYDVLDAALNRGTLRITNQQVPAAVRQSAADDARNQVTRLRRAFRDWLFSPAAAAHLAGVEERFNAVFGAFVPMRTDGSYLRRLPGIANTFEPRQVQLDAAARALGDGRAIEALAPGFGKTATGAIIIAEMCRLKMAERALFVADNPSFEQVVEEISDLYPGLRILRVDNEDVSPRGRAEFMERACQGGWDLMICSRTQFVRMPLRPSTYLDQAREHLRRMETHLGELLRSENDNRNAVRRLDNMVQAARRQLWQTETRVRSRAATTGRTFEDLDIQLLVLDESHAYTRRGLLDYPGDRIRGLPSGESLRAEDTVLKARVVGRQVVALTGTPLNNSIAEAYTMLRLVAPDVLERFGMSRFVNFLRTFAVENEQLECDEVSGTWRPVRRISGIRNGPEFMHMFRSVMEVRMDARECGIELPQLRGGGYQQLVSPRTRAFERVQSWIMTAKDAWEHLPAQERTRNGAGMVALQASISASIDPRLVDPNAEDDPRSLVNEMVHAALDMFEREHRLGRPCNIPIFVGRFRPFSSRVLSALAGDVREFQNLLAADETSFAPPRAEQLVPALPASSEPAPEGRMMRMPTMDEEAAGAAPAEPQGRVMRMPAFDDGEGADTAAGDAEEDLSEVADAAAVLVETRLAEALAAERREAAEAAWDFNLQHDIRDKLLAGLRARGIPVRDDQVVATCDVDNRELRSVCERAGRGEVYFEIGTHQRIGQGLNYHWCQRGQFHTIPSDMVPTTLTQARCRGERPGNQYGQIDVVMCAMQDSPAVGIVGRMLTKERLGSQLLTPDGGALTGVEFDDPFTPLRANEMMAYLVSDPRQRERADLLQRIRNEEVRGESEGRRRRDLDWQLSNAERDLVQEEERMRYQLPRLERMVAAMPDFSAGSTVSARWICRGIDPIPMPTDPAVIQQTLDAWVNEWRQMQPGFNELLTNRSLGEMNLGQFSIHASLRFDGFGRAELEARVSGQGQTFAARTFRGGAGFMRIALDAREEMSREITNIQRRARHAREEVETLRQTVAAAAAQGNPEAILAQLREELARLEQDMVLNARTREWDEALPATRRVLADGTELREHERRHGSRVPFTPMAGAAAGEIVDAMPAEVHAMGRSEPFRWQPVIYALPDEPGEGGIGFAFEEFPEPELLASAFRRR